MRECEKRPATARGDGDDAAARGSRTGADTEAVRLDLRLLSRVSYKVLILSHCWELIEQLLNPNSHSREMIVF